MSLLLYFANIACCACQSAAGKLYAIKGGQSRTFNLYKTLSAVLLFFIWFLLRRQSLHWNTVPWAVLYGIFFAASMHTGFAALSIGPMALTSVIASMSLVVPFAWSILFWQEQLTALSAIGVVLLFAAIILINVKKQGNASRQWLILSLLTMLANGFCSVLQKYHQRFFPGQYQVDFVLLSMSASAVILSAVQLIKREKLPKPCLLGVVSGVMNGTANWIVLLLAATQNASSLFPLISAGNAMASWLAGCLIFREKTQKLQFLGLAAGIAGVIILNL